jgi:hypothetical protein
MKASKLGLKKVGAWTLSALALSAVACTEEAPPVETPIDTGDDGTGGEGGAGITYEEPKTLQTALSEFGSCMNLDVWIKTGIYKLYKSATEGGEACGSCHSTGDGAAYLSDDVLATFDENSRFPGVMRLVTGTVDERGNFDALVPANRYIDKGVDPCLEGEACHPRFELTAEMQNAVLTFVEETLDRYESGNCDAPYLAEEQ